MLLKFDKNGLRAAAAWLAVLFSLLLASCVSSVDAISDTTSLAENTDQASEPELNSDISSADPQGEIAFVPTKAPRTNEVVQQLAAVASTPENQEETKPVLPTESNSPGTTNQVGEKPAGNLNTSITEQGQQGTNKKPSLLQRLLQARADKRAQEKQREAFRKARKSSRPRIVARTRNVNGSALPGVRKRSKLFNIDDGDERDNIQVASVGGFGRLSPNGLRLQHSRVEVGCLKPDLLKILKIVERKYRQKPIVTSGYRSPKRNRRAGGASNSQHIYCKAADIQLDGVSKWDLAKFLRSIRGRGGVGTYCRTRSVHIDIGPKRDWHHPCRRSVLRRKRKA